MCLFAFNYQAKVEKQSLMQFLREEKSFTFKVTLSVKNPVVLSSGPLKVEVSTPYSLSSVPLEGPLDEQMQQGWKEIWSSRRDPFTDGSLEKMGFPMNSQK